jgi:hypothetical protein
MELFDKKYVYFEWDDKLAGKDVFISNSMDWLKTKVNTCDSDRLVKIKKSKDLSAPFHVIGFDGNDNNNIFAYYDPNLKVKKAWLDGEVIQIKSKGEWYDLLNMYLNITDLNELKWDNNEWRVKPIEKWYVVLTDKGLYKTNFGSLYYVFYVGTEKECDTYIKEHESMKDTMKAWLNKETVQYFDSVHNEWVDTDFPLWKSDIDYRVKPTKETEKYKLRRMTNRELSRWLAEGNGEMKTEYFSPNALNFISTIYTSYDYLEGTENEEIGTYIHIRDWGSDEWKEPLIEV